MTTALSGTDDGTVTLKIGSTAVTNGLITIAASSAINTQDSATPTALNIISAGDIISAVSAKTTTGGAALVSITLTRTP